MAEHSGQIEIWKKIIDVQQHFNDLELRIRNFALVVTGAFLGIGGYAVKDGGVIKLLGLHVSIAGIVVVFAVFPLFAFYFMDRFWYHRLLDGAVAAGVEAETELKSLGYKVDLGTKISQASPIKIPFFGWNMRSKNKMDLFYGILIVSLLGISAVLGFGLNAQNAQNAQAPEVKMQVPRTITSAAPAKVSPTPTAAQH